MQRGNGMQYHCVDRVVLAAKMMERLDASYYNEDYFRPGYGCYEEASKRSTWRKT